MSVLEHEYNDLLFLIIASLVLGFVLAFLYVFIKDAAFISATFRAQSFSRFSVFRNALSHSISKASCATALADVLVFSLGGVGLVFVTFLYNYGQFRFISIPFLLIGYFVALKLFSPLVAEILIIIFYAIKQLSSILFFPLLLIYRYLCLPVCRMIKRVIKRIVVKVYTAYRFKKLVRKVF